MDLASFLVGMVVAWIIALLIYWFGVQRDATDKIANTVPLNEHLAQVQDAEDRIAQLQAELQERRHALEEAQAEREQLRAENEQLQVEVASAMPEQAPTESTMPEEVSAATEEAAVVVPSDLKRVEGIGPKIEEILNNAGIHTFQQLAESNVERLQTVLQEAGERYRMADPHTWPEQARLAAEEKWDELAALQDQLKGGR